MTTTDEVAPLNDYPARTTSSSKTDDRSSWHRQRCFNIRRLQEHFCWENGEPFDLERFGVTIDYRFGEGDSNKYADAFAATVDTTRKPCFCEPPKKKRRKAAASFFVQPQPEAVTRKEEEKSDAEAGEKISMALKVVPLDMSEACYVNTPMTPGALRYSVWAERLALLLCSELVKASVTPSLPFLIRCYACEQPFSPLAEKQRPFQRAIVLCNELARGGNMLQWAEQKHRRPVREWHACLFHLFAAMYALQKYCGMTHHDLHMENILLMETDQSGEESEEQSAANAQHVEKYWQYSIDDQTYYVPDCLGFVPIIWDFGTVFCPQLCPNEAFAHVHPRDESERKCADASLLLTILGEMRDAGEISIPISSWRPYQTVLSWERFSLRFAIPFLFRRLFGRRPASDSAMLLEPIYDISRPTIRPQDDTLAPYFTT